MFARIFGRRKPSAPAAKRPTFAPQLTALEAREVPATFTVTNTSAAFATSGSLPWAVHQSNYFSPGVDFIRFNIGGGGRQVINLTSTLYINSQMVIDGTTQPGYAGVPLISIQGNSNVPSLFLLQNDPSQQTTSSGSTIQGLEMTRYTNNAITIFSASTGNWVQDNYMGFARNSAENVVRNTSEFSTPTYHPAGLGIASSFNTIRGNTISGVYNGINMGEDPLGTYSGAQYKTNSIQGNRIGTDPTGTTAAGYGNLSDGIFLGAGARENFLGPNNTLSGNGSAGVEMLHGSNIGNVVFASKIGLNQAGTAVIGNGELGILLANGATGNAIGGPFGGNVISGNALGGVSFGTAGFGGASGNWVQYNVMGLNEAQTAIVGTQQVGLSFELSSNSNVIEGNVFAGHTQHGVRLAGVQGNFLRGNWVGQSATGTAFANGGFGIALLSNANFNFVWDTAYGVNVAGNLWIHDGRDGQPIASGNSIR